MNGPENLAGEFTKLGPWIYQFQIGGQTYGGGISAVGDVRVERFLQFAPQAKMILELGSLEGAQSFILAQRPGVKRVVALEGREANLRKARLAQDLLEIPNVEFVQANLEHADLAGYGKFDAVFCCGLLYHLPEPWTLLRQLPKLAPLLFIWTQYAAAEEAHDLANGLRGKIHVEGGADEPLSGMSSTATWLTLDSLRDVLTTSGYKKIEVIDNDPAHANGPAVTIGAATGD
ncbi:MAG TPA: class I SAM-dependent methyltransferase [Chthoniobacterales bacterium]|nr:class I SAM-dependent methyltransferase [Chthoniobacterales bacterium]